MEAESGAEGNGTTGVHGAVEKNLLATLLGAAESPSDGEGPPPAFTHDFLPVSSFAGAARGSRSSVTTEPPERGTLLAESPREESKAFTHDFLLLVSSFAGAARGSGSSVATESPKRGNLLPESPREECKARADSSLLSGSPVGTDRGSLW